MRSIKNNCMIVLLSVVTYFWLTFNIIDGIVELFPKKDAVLQNTVIFLGTIIFYKAVFYNNKIKFKKYICIFIGMVSVYFSINGMFGKVYASAPEVLASGAVLWRSYNLLKSVVCFLGGVGLFTALMVLVGNLPLLTGKYTRKISSYLEGFFNKSFFWRYFFIIFLCWLPHIIIRLPGAIVRDSWNMLSMYYGLKGYTTQHPIIFTLLLGKFTDLGKLLGNSNIGLILLVVLQSFITMLILAYMIQSMCKLAVPNVYTGIALVMFAISPILIASCTTILKDTPYIAAFLLLIVEGMYILYYPEEYEKSARHLILTAAAVLGMFFRKNGIIIIPLFLSVIVIREVYFIVWKKKNVRFTALIILVMLLPLLLGSQANRYWNEKYEAAALPNRAILTIPMQQIARYMCLHGEEVSEDELKILQKVVKWNAEEYQKRYRPFNFDGIKMGYNSEAEKGDIKEYLMVWLKLFFRHPMSYIDATMNQTYFLFDVSAENQAYYKDVEAHRPDNVKDWDIYSNIKAFEKSREKIVLYYQSFSRFPIIGFFVNQGIFMVILVAICLNALNRKGVKTLILSLPMLLTLAITFVGPAVSGHPRYTYPIVYAMPLLLGAFIMEIGNMKMETGEEQAVALESGKSE